MLLVAVSQWVPAADKLNELTRLSRSTASLATPASFRFDGGVC